MSKFSDNAISASWSVFQARIPKSGINREQSGSPDILRFDRNDCILSIRLEAGRISYQVTSESRTGFPEPIQPAVLGVEGSKDVPIMVELSGEERTPEEAFDHLMNWFYDVSGNSAQERRFEGR